MASGCPLSRSWGLQVLKGKLGWEARPGWGRGWKRWGVGAGVDQTAGCLLTFRALLDKGSTDMFAEGALWAET